MVRCIAAAYNGTMGERGTGLNSKRRKQRGQVAILFALVFTFMFVLFAMVVDFGHLVNNKINLQNAADAAAYAGAAWQAQALSRLGQMNYYLRQNVKELAMRVHVTHLRHNRNYPRGSNFYGGNGGTPNVEPFICQQAHGYQALSGLKYRFDTNLCRNASPSTGGLPPIVVPPVIASFDPFAVAIAAQIRKIADAAKQECAAAAQDNRRLAEHLVNVYTRRSQFHASQIREIENWINEVGGGNAANNQHKAVQTAFETARRNLTLANRDEFEMQVLRPSGNEYIRLNQNVMRASLFYVNFNVEGEGCVGRPSFLDFDGMVSGVNKDQTIVTYFAVKLTSKPRMLFMPQAWIDAAFPTLVAFAAAKPFGSRIGPDVNADQLVPVPNRPGNNNRMINFSLRPGDNLGIMNTKVMAMLDALHPFNQAGRPEGEQNAGWPDPRKGGNLRTALRAITAPTLFDALMYTIFPNPSRPDDYAEPNFALALYPDYMEAGDGNNQIVNIPTPRTPAYFPTSGKELGNGYIPVAAPETGTRYGNIEYAEEDPASHAVELASDLPIIGGKEREFGWADRDAVNSGWAPEGRPGRIGYSVKFISFDALTRSMVVRDTNGGAPGPIRNPPTGDPNVNNIWH
jgi:hypothetical protein